MLAAMLEDVANFFEGGEGHHSLAINKEASRSPGCFEPGRMLDVVEGVLGVGGGTTSCLGASCNAPAHSSQVRHSSRFIKVLSGPKAFSGKFLCISIAWMATPRASIGLPTWA